MPKLKQFIESHGIDCIEREDYILCALGYYWPDGRCRFEFVRIRNLREALHHLGY